MGIEGPRRRTIIATLSAVAAAGCLNSSGSMTTAPPYDSKGEPTDSWQLVVDEQWETLNTDRWAVGFIDREEWIPNDDATVSADHVHVDDGTCTLEVESRGTGPDGCFQGVINSSVGGGSNHPTTGIPIDPVPGQYVEARLKLPGRTGVLPAFWMHPANRNWPPEIDIVELFQPGETDPQEEREQLHTDVHWSKSGQPNDRETHEHDPVVEDTEVNLTESFNTFGCAWFADRIEWYFNDNRIDSRSAPPAMLESLTAAEAQPFGLIFSNHVNRIGQADLTTSWTEQLQIKWVRIWKQS
jgi:hypothetical protein